MKNRKITQIIILSLGILALATLPACGKKTSETKVSKDYVYKYEELPASQDMGNISSMLIAGDTKYVYGVEWDDSYENATLILNELNNEGTVVNQAKIDQPSGIFYNSLTGSEDGSIYSIKTHYQEDTTNPAESVYKENYYLIKLDSAGREVWSVCLNEIKELNDQDYFYTNSVICISEQKLLVYAMEKYAVFDSAGNYQGLFTLTGPGVEENQGNLGNMLLLGDGRLMNYRYTEKGLVFQEINPETGVLGEEQLLTGNIYSYTIYRGAGYDLFLVDYSNVYGYDIGQEPIKLMNYVDSDLNIYGINSLVAIDRSTFWGFISDETNSSILARFTKVDPKDVADKVSITLAGSYIDWDVKKQVVKFNKSNDKYRIYVLDYGALYNTTEDYQAGRMKLNTDIASGKAPDILLVNSDFPIKNYAAKGLFADMIPFIEKDEELSMEDLLPNVVKAFSTDGHLYQLPPSFSVMTVFAKTSDVGSEPGWTVRQAQDLLASKPEGTELFDSMTRSYLFYNSMYMGGEQFVDWEKGECYYDSEAFIALLELIKTFPEEADYAKYEDPNYWNEWENAWKNGKILTQIGTIDSFRTYNRIKKTIFGEDITMIGFPTESGIGSTLNSYMSFAISAKSKNQEGAWEFVRGFLKDEYQSNISYTLPISIKAFHKMGEEAMKKQTYEDELGRQVATDEFYYVGEQEMVLEPISAADLEKVKSFIYTVEEASAYNEDLLNIITEESAPFFEGQKSVKEVVDIIQSRAKIYVNENR